MTYKLIKPKDELTLDEKIEMLNQINGYNGMFDYLEYWENDEDFFNIYYGNNPMNAVRATFYGNYRYYDEYVTINVYGNIESYDKWTIEEKINDELDDIIEEFVNLLEEMNVADWNNLFKEG